MPIKGGLGAIVAAGTPDWMQSLGPITPKITGDPGGNAQNMGTVAYVDPSNPQPNINVVNPGLFTPAVAAHEMTHNYQNSRNAAFVQNTQAMQPTTGNTSNYDYGGVAGLLSNPLKSIGNYNPEQQASMVQNLTQAQSQLPANPTRAQLQQWDVTKNALERPIQQLKDIPPADTSMLGRISSSLQGDPIGYLRQFLSPSLPAAPQAVPGPPSAALGYALKSR
jgi:hypothetical protein